jgi:hypothetical protein
LDEYQSADESFHGYWWSLVVSLRVKEAVACQRSYEPNWGEKKETIGRCATQNRRRDVGWIKAVKREASACTQGCRRTKKKGWKRWKQEAGCSLILGWTGTFERKRNFKTEIVKGSARKVGQHDSYKFSQDTRYLQRFQITSDFRKKWKH